MNQELVIRIMPSMGGDVSASSLQWLVRGAEECLESMIRCGSFADLKVWSEKMQTECPDQWPEQAVVLVSGTMVTLQCLSVSAAQKNHLQQALPYLIEEKVVRSIEEEHIVGLAQSGEDGVLVGSIAIDAMTHVLEQLLDSGIIPASVVPENCLWPSDKNTVTLLFECGMVTLWSDTVVAQTIDLAVLPLVLSQYFDPEITSADDSDAIEGESHQEASTTHVKVLYELKEGEPQLSEYNELAGREITLEAKGTETRSVLAALVALLQERRKVRAVIELRSGAFRCSRKAGKRWRQWRPAVCVAGLWLVFEFLFYSGQGFWYQYNAADYYDRNYALYKEINPSDRSVVDVRSRFSSLLRRAGTTNADNGFLQMLNTVSRVNAQAEAKGVEPTRLDFNESDGGLAISVSATSFDAINRYLEALRQAGLQATMEAANQEGDTVVARLSMKSS